MRSDEFITESPSPLGNGLKRKVKLSKRERAVQQVAQMQEEKTSYKKVKGDLSRLRQNFAKFGARMANAQEVENYFYLNKRENPDIYFDDSYPIIDYICPACEKISKQHDVRDDCPHCGEPTELDGMIMSWDDDGVGHLE